jgi:threonine/homoserine/homoserine lactone efflux protein
MTMTLSMAAAFAAAFFLLALSPGPGLAAILSRSLGGGLPAGFAVVSGLVVGDAIFLAAALIGLSAIASTLGPLFQVVKYAGAAYLIWLGITALRATSTPIAIEASAGSSLSVGALMRDVTLGLMVTLGNPKPILFYGALLPTFLDLATVTPRDFAVLMAIVTTVSFTVYLGYMVLVERARRLLATTSLAQRLNQATGVLLIGTGVAVAAR